MNKVITLLLLSFLVIGCNSVKRNQNFIAKGNYNSAIELAVKKLQKGKNNEKRDAHIILLEDAYKKAVDEDRQRISFLNKENNPFYTRELYYLNVGLEERQGLIRPLLPLYSTTLGRNAKFKIRNYSKDILDTKREFVNHLYNEGERYMSYNNTMEFRNAYTIYCELTDIHPNYKDSKELLEEAHFYGTDFVFVALNNQSFQIIPFRLERELLNFNTYGLDDFWTEYHSKKQNDLVYNFGITLNFRAIDFSPERISEKEYTRKKRIKDGWEYKRDRYGNIINDEDGNPIKVDKYKTVTAILLETIQTKAVFVGGELQYLDLQRNREINHHSLASEFVFENIFATYRGDERALTNADKILVNNRFIPFPNNAQMLLDAGEDLKIQLKEILKRNSFR